MWVYRVQDKSGIGCYATHDLGIFPYSAWQEHNHAYSSKPGRAEDWTPNPLIEGLSRTDAHRCGFKSLDQLQAWFTPRELVRLWDLGFKPTRVKADPSTVEIGRKQLIFVPI